MPKKPKRPRDANQLAKLIVDLATGEKADEVDRPANAKTSERARKAGKRGGPARAAKLPAEKRQEYARKAANARWGRK